MRQIVEIALRELRSLFYSPIGWLTLIVFSIHSAFVLSGRLDGAISIYELRGEDYQYFSFMFFNSPMVGLFRVMPSFFFLYLPLLTMGLLSREYQDGSIKLLFSSPIRTHQIILGKYLAIALFTGLFIAIYLAQVIVVKLYVLESIDFGLIILGMLVNYLIICMYLAIGLFISSVTVYPLAAAVGSFAVIFALNNYLSVMVANHHPELIQLIFAQWMPPGRHFESISGLLNSGQLAYFILFTLLFLVLTYLRLVFLRTSKTTTYKLSTVSVVVAIIFWIGLFLYNPDHYKYWDFTDTQRFSASVEQNEWMSKHENQPISLTKYVPILEQPFEGGILGGFAGRYYSYDRMRKSLKTHSDLQYVPFIAPTNNLSLSFFEEASIYSDARVLAREIPERLDRSTENLDLQEMASLATEKFSWIRPEKILFPNDVVEIFDTTLVRYHSVYFMQIGDKSDVLNIGLGFPTDQELTASLKSLIKGKYNVGFPFMNGERNPFEESESHLSRILTNRFGQYSLINHGFQIVGNEMGSLGRYSVTDTLQLDGHKDIGIDNKHIFDKSDLIVLADPLLEYSEDDLDNIKQWIDSGKNIMILSSIDNYEVINELIGLFGLQFTGRKSTEMYASVLPSAVSTAENTSGFLLNNIAKYRNRNSTLLKSQDSGAVVSMAGATTIQRNESTQTFNLAPVVATDTDTLIYALYREIDGVPQQRIIVSASTDFISNRAEGIGFHSSYNEGMSNSTLAISLFRWLSNDEYPVLVEQEPHNEQLIYRDIGLIKVGMVWGLPSFLLIAGCLVLVRRRRT